MFYRKWKIKNIILDMRSATLLEAFLIKQGVLFFAHRQCFRRAQRHARAIARLMPKPVFHNFSYSKGLRDSEHPHTPPHPPPTPDHPAPLTFDTLAFPWSMFTSGIISVFYIILFPTGFSNIHLQHYKTIWD